LDEAKRAEFREKLSGYVRLYAFISQIVPYADPEMEMLYSYGRFLVPHLPIERDPAIKPTDEVGLQYYCLERASTAFSNATLTGSRCEAIRASRRSSLRWRRNDFT
jgi:hypothetical protein